MSKLYVGKGWIGETKYGPVVNLSLKMEELEKLIQNKWGEIEVTVAQMKQKDEKSGATHTVFHWGKS